MSKTFEKQAITAEFAQKLIEAAVAKAVELKVPQFVAVVDDGGNLKAFVRMDGAALIQSRSRRARPIPRCSAFRLTIFSTSSKATPHWSLASRPAREWRRSAAAIRSKSTATSSER